MAIICEVNSYAVFSFCLRGSKTRPPLSPLINYIYMYACMHFKAMWKIQSLDLQMPSTLGAGPGRNLEPRTWCGSSIRVAGTQVLKPSSASKVHISKKLAWTELELQPRQSDIGCSVLTYSDPDYINFSCQCSYLSNGKISSHLLRLL